MNKARWLLGLAVLALGTLLLLGCRVSESGGADVDATVQAAVDATMAALDRPTQIPGAALGPPTPEPTRKAGATQTPQDNIRRVTAPELKAMVDAGEAVIVDARVATAYEQKHIAGAISIPWNEIANRLNELPRDKHISFY